MGGEDAFSHHAVHAGDDLRELAAAAKFHADAAVAGKPTSASEDEIPQASEPGHGFLPTAAGHDQTRDLSQAARDERSDGIVAEPEPVAHTGRDGNNVLERASQCPASDIVVGVNPETGITEFELDSFR